MTATAQNKTFRDQAESMPVRIVINGLKKKPARIEHTGHTGNCRCSKPCPHGCGMAAEEAAGTDMYETDLPQDWKNLTPDGIRGKLGQHGFMAPSSIMLIDQKASLRVVDKEASSSYDACSDAGLCIREDETFAEWWTKVKGGHDSSTVTSEGNSVSVYGTTFSFERTLRVPDSNGNNRLPPSLGSFPIKPVKNFIDKLPENVVARSGYILPMYQREAMWIRLSHTQKSCNAVKVSVGGINALTGTLKGEAGKPGVQDYLCKSQPWLDGIVKESGSVRQFVAMKVGEGYTVEEQLTGKNAEATLQLDVFPGFRQDIEVTIGTSKVDKLWNTPADVGAKPGDVVYLRQRTKSGSYTFNDLMLLHGSVLTFNATYHGSTWQFYSAEGLDTGTSFGASGARCGAFSRSAPISMGLASGGSIVQQIDGDPKDIRTYDYTAGKQIYIHFINAGAWQQITGETNPVTQVSKAAYKKHNIPWFDLYNEPEPAKDLGAGFANIQSVNDIDAAERANRQGGELKGPGVKDEILFSERWQSGEGKIVDIDHGQLFKATYDDGNAPFVHLPGNKRVLENYGCIIPLLWNPRDDDVSPLTK